MISIRKFIDGYEVIDAGELHTVSELITFEVAGLKIKFCFSTDKALESARYQSENVDGELVMRLINFSNSLGEGVLAPLSLATTDGRDIAVTFYVFSINSPNGLGRRFSYSFLLGPKQDD